VENLFRWGRYNVLSTLFVVFFSFAVLPAAASETSKISVLPFKIYAPARLTYLKNGLQDMFSVRLEKLGTEVTSQALVNKHPLAYSTLRQEDIYKIGKDLASRFVIQGSMTQIGKKLSLDVKLFDLKTRETPFYFYRVAEDVESLPETVDRLVESVFNRITGVPQVDSVEVTGNKRIEKEAILAVIQTSKGNPLNHDQLDRDLRDVYKMGFFKDVQIETKEGAKGERVIFHVTEKPSIGKIVFEGNKKIKDDDLRKELGVKIYSILDENQVKQSTNRLKEFYRQKGYYNAVVEEHTEPLPNNEVLLRYSIREQKKVYITKIQFLGNKAFSSGNLRDIMETSEKGFFSWLTDSGYLDRKKLDFDVEKISAYYHNHGYINAKVGVPRVAYVKDKGLEITIEIEEGLQFTVGKVSIEGDLIKPAEELLKMIQIGKEKVFNRETVRKDMLVLRNVYADEGYAYAEVSPMTKEDREGRKVDITYRISKGPKVHFERIDITGNTFTRDKVIRREIKAIEGDYFSGEAVRKSSENLNRLGFFENLSIQPKRGSQEDSMILDVHVKERPTGWFSFGVGYSSVDKTILSLQVSENNFLGLGQRLSASAQFGSVSSQYSLNFTEPWFLGRPISLSASLYKWERIFTDYTQNSQGTNLGLGFPLGIDEYTRGTVSYNLDDTNISGVADTASFSIRDMIGRSLTSSITTGISRDSRDRPWNTHKGSINSITFEYAGGFLSGDLYFNKYQARSAWYFPLPWDTVLLAQGRWGLERKRPGGKLPVFEKFTLGGIDTVRGFDYAAISPLDPITGDRIGGEKMMVYNLEYRFPLAKEQGVVGLVFFDAGNVFEKDEAVTFSGIRRSVGAGVRWYSPVGPLRMEYGKNLAPRSGEPSGRWEFSVGGAF
jgi:outer membrane protein insertion porin family